MRDDNFGKEFYRLKNIGIWNEDKVDGVRGKTVQKLKSQF